jgi:hypothetical protein
MNKLFGRVATVPTPNGARPPTTSVLTQPTSRPPKRNLEKLAKTEFRCGSLRWLIELLRLSLARETRQVIYSKIFIPSQL